ncbi:type II toxin-antitoxin system HicB family antitoxin [Halorarius halobius]|uniref:type II toxin-antitoxin system HicB family antitoxin n=1 Tax=Halorarius halobius TaxID=2962671 RepID=UPI0020CD4139|nr:type II toxin-antitoxin system HicB family antitoxin [Halorarius halobius]
MSTGREIRLTENDDGRWTARDIAAEVTSQGRTREEALTNLDEAVALAAGDIGHEPTDEELRDLGIDPADNTSGGELPDVLQ